MSETDAFTIRHPFWRGIHGLEVDRGSTSGSILTIPRKRAMTTKPAPLANGVTYPLNTFRSFPAEIGSSAPLNPVKPPERVEFPQEMTLTDPGLVLPPMDAVYVIIPPLTYPHTEAVAPVPAKAD